MKTNVLKAESALAALVGVGVFVQVYLIAAFTFGADTLDAHKHVGNAVVVLIVLTALHGFVARWGNWKAIAPSAALLVAGIALVGLAEGDTWVGGLHGLLALVVLVLAGIIHVRAMRAAKAATAG